MSEALVTQDDHFIPPAGTFVGKLEPNYYCRSWNEKRKKYCSSRAGKGTAHVGEGRCYFHGGHKKDGDHRIRHGGHSTMLQGRSDRVRALIEAHLADPSKLYDVSVPLATAKALMDDFIERYYEIIPQLAAWYQRSQPLQEDQRLALLSCLEELEAAVAEPTKKQTDDLALARAAVAHLAEPRAEKPRQLLDISEAVRHADTISKIIHRVNMAQAQNAVSYQRLATFMFELGRVLENLVPDREQLQRINQQIADVRI